MKTPRLDLNPSSAARWVTCTASPRFILENADKLPPDDTVYNQEGTTAHEVAAAMLQNREPDPKECPTPITKEMRKHAWNYMEYVQSLGGKPIVEQKFPLWYNEGRNGKVDVLTVAGGHTHVVDYKYGQGVIVDPFENLQGAIYARSAMSEVLAFGGIEKGKLAEAPVTIHIYQPRGRGAEDSPFHVWETNWGEILDFTHQVTEAAKLILSDGKTEFLPSDKACRFCPANTMVPGDTPGTMKKLCPALQKKMNTSLEVLPPLEKKMHFPPVKALTVAQVSAFIQYGEDIKEYVDDVKAYALELMKAGTKIDGFKLVQGRAGNRYWTDSDRAAALLLKETHLRENEVWEKSVVSPGGAEKLLGKHGLTVDLLNLIARAEGKPTIAPAADKRPEFGGIDPKLEFGDL